MSADIITTTVTNQFTLIVNLVSDDETQPPYSPAQIDASIAETGSPQDLTLAFEDLFDLDSTNPLPTVIVQSDLDVPEPASLGLFATALIGAGAVRWRKRKAA